MCEEIILVFFRAYNYCFTSLSILFPFCFLNFHLQKLKCRNNMQIGLRKLGLFSLEKRRLCGHHSSFPVSEGGLRGKPGRDSLLETLSMWQRGMASNWKTGDLERKSLQIIKSWKKWFTVRAVRPWSSCPEQLWTPQPRQCPRCVRNWAPRSRA